MKFQISTILFLLIFIFYGCNNSQRDSIISSINIDWELVTNYNNQKKTEVVFTFQNMGDKAFGSNWNMYFSQANVMPSKNQLNQQVEVSHINGDWFKLSPKFNFKLEKGKTQKFTFQFNGPFIKLSDAPMGVYFVENEGTDKQQIISPKEFNVLPFTRPEQLHREEIDYVQIPTAVNRYRENASIVSDVGNISRIIPSPYNYVENGNQLIIKDELKVFFDSNLTSEVDYFESAIKTYSAIKIAFVNEEEANVLFKKSPLHVNGISAEAYSLGVSSNKIEIIGNDNAGVFYGIQSLLSLITINPNEFHIQVSQGLIKDAPRFSYRGLQLDVARNFQTKESVMKVIDLLATYKINTLLLYLTEDEGWRIEIEDLPELTDIGSRRVHATMDSPALHPSYGSGPDPDSSGNNGTGYYSKEDFIEILKYAKQRHVNVIPEVNLPGHARAAIKAMEFRYEKYMKDGNVEEAEKYRLIDPEDKSIYTSAQSFKDNVVCVCRASVYTFYEKVIDEIIELYEDADAPLEYFHTGGDEVPRGPWTQSPMCEELIAQLPEVDSPSELHTYFFRKTVEILKERNLKVAAWEEATLKHENGELIVNSEFANSNVVPYTWNNLWGAQDLAYKFANRGYEVVLCPVTNFYFDLAYDKDPEEPGLYWAGFVDSKNSYEFAPYDMFKTTPRDDAMYTPINPEEQYKNMERLNIESRKNIIGIQAQLWGETLKGEAMMEHYLLPKLFGFAESAWSKEKVWETTENPVERAKQVQQGWSAFTHSIGNYQLERLDYLNKGYAYRIPKPGATVEDGYLKANTKYPNLIIRFTTDGSEPTLESPIYTQPVQVNGTVKLKTFSKNGRSSNTEELDLNKETIKL